jgi:hypothetical protein
MKAPILLIVLLLLSERVCYGQDTVTEIYSHDMITAGHFWNEDEGIVGGEDHFFYTRPEWKHKKYLRYYFKLADIAAQDLYAIWFLSRDTGFIAGRCTNFSWSDASAFVAWTTDGGLTWSDKRFPEAKGSVPTFFKFFTPNESHIVLGHNWLISTESGGLSADAWQIKQLPAQTYTDYTGTYFQSFDHGVVGSHWYPEMKIWQTLDAGTSWDTTMTQAPGTVFIEPNLRNRLVLAHSNIIVSSSGIHTSTDRGQSWINSRWINRNATLTSNGKDVWAIPIDPGWDSIYISNDGGLSWNAYYYPSAVEMNFLVPRISVLNDSVAYVFRSNRGYSKLRIKPETLNVEQASWGMSTPVLAVKVYHDSRAIEITSENDSEVLILDAIGRVVQRTRIDAQQPITMDVRAMPSGLYFARDSHFITPFRLVR